MSDSSSMPLNLSALIVSPFNGIFNLYLPPIFRLRLVAILACFCYVIVSPGKKIIDYDVLYISLYKTDVCVSCCVVAVVVSLVLFVGL